MRNRETEGVTHEAEIDRLAGLEVDYSKLDKVFASHLHTDHVGDIAALWVGGWLNGRYTPLHVYGPSGSSLPNWKSV